MSTFGINGENNGPLVGGWLKNITAGAHQWVVLNPHALEIYASPAPQSAPLRVVPRALVQFFIRDKFNREPMIYIYSAGIRDLCFQSTNERPPAPNGPPAFKQDPKADNELDRWIKALDNLKVPNTSGTVDMGKFTTAKGRKEFQEKIQGYNGGQAKPTFTEEEMIELHPGGSAGYFAEKSAGPVNGENNGPLVGGWLKNITTGAHQWLVLNPHALEIYAAPAPQCAPLRIVTRAQIQFMARDKFNREPMIYIYSAGIRDLCFQSTNERPPVTLPPSAPLCFKQEAKADSEIDRWIKAFDGLKVPNTSGTVDVAKFATAKGRKEFQEKIQSYGGGQPKPTFTEEEMIELHPGGSAGYFAEKSAGPVNGENNGPLVGGWLKNITTGAHQWLVLNPQALEIYAAPAPQCAPLRIVTRAQIQFMARDKFNREPMIYIYSAGIRDLCFQSTNERPPVTLPPSAPLCFKQEAKADSEIDRWIKAFDGLKVPNTSGTVDVSKFTTAKGRKEFQEKIQSYGGGQPAPTFTQEELIELHPGGAAGFAAQQAAGPVNGASTSPLVGGWLKHVPTQKDQWVVLTKQGIDIYAAALPLGAPIRQVPLSSITFLTRDKKTREPFLYFYSPSARDLCWQSMNVANRPPVNLGAAGANPAEFKALEKGDDEINRWIKAVNNLNIDDTSDSIYEDKMQTVIGRAEQQAKVAGYGKGQPAPVFTAAEEAELTAAKDEIAAGKAASKAAAAASGADYEDPDEEDNEMPFGNGFKEGLSIYADIWINYDGKTYFGIFSDQQIELYNQQYRSNRKIEEQPVVTIPNEKIRKYAANSNKSADAALILYGPGQERHVFTVPPAYHGNNPAVRYKVVEKILGGLGVFHPIPGASWNWELQRDFVNNRASFEQQVAEYTGGD